jgi:DNA-binding transcriptional ArsR family regulator
LRVTGNLRDRIISKLADPESRQILTSVFREHKTAIMIGQEVALPPSTLYRKISELKECGLLMVDSFSIRPDGKREARYVCTFNEIVFKPGEGEVELEITSSARSLEKRWFDLFFSKTTERFPE